MKKNVLTIILLSLAIITWGMASLFKILITSDIPVSYSRSEAITVQSLFSLATLLFLITLSSFTTNKPRIIIGISCLLFFILKLFIIKNNHIGAEYFNSSFAQLEVSSLLSLGILVLFNFYLLFKRDGQK